MIGPMEELADAVVERYWEAIAVPVPTQPRNAQDDHKLASY
ncbi:hypothetical protein [Streptomyces lacrimifluminis]|nr:hypothetical protein [Streptomyces lacrimifluminis]